ncbi:MAG TPA: CocE/NonD family hydrolase [Nitrospiraceae bacterium]|nr:CocE/NonD family hydrolase [Nitrospiraceae bacterium]
MATGTRSQLYQGSSQQFEVVERKHAMVPMRDGIHLATDLYFPALNGRPLDGSFPCLVERTPYSKEQTNLVSTARFFARRGYVVAMQDVRGRGLSEGICYLFAKEGPDGYDTVEWLGEQSWCNGQVGTIGLSYSGSDQHALATLCPPYLKAMFVSMGMSNYHTSAMRQSGALEQRFLVYAFRMAANSKEAMANRTLRESLERAHANVKAWLSKPFKLGASPLRELPHYEQWAWDILTHGDYDDYWKQHGYNVEEYYNLHADVPICLLTGWYDTYTRSSTDNFVKLRERFGNCVHLVIGPWLHALLDQSNSGEVEFGVDAPIDYNDLRLRWFDRWLKSLDTGIDTKPPVRLFIMGGGDGHRTEQGNLYHGGRWRDEQEWPLARTRWTEYYLRQDGLISLDPPGDEAPSGFRFDPRDPVPTIGGSISAASEVMLPGAFNQRGRLDFIGCKDDLPLAARPDVLVFESLPLNSDLEVTGPLTVNIWASSSAVDTDFTVKLLDVYPPSPDYPDGFQMNIADGIIRARYRSDREHPELLNPGEIYKFTITPYPTSNVFQKGHRIAVHISSSNWPRFDVNPNTGEPVGRHTRMIVADQVIYHTRDYPSHIVLPVIPAEDGAITGTLGSEGCP